MLEQWLNNGEILSKTLTHEQLCRADFYTWIVSKAYLPNGEKFTFDGYEYLEDFCKSPWKPGDQKYVRKSSQCGASEIAIDSIFWMNDRDLPKWKGSGLVFPAVPQLQAHLKARVFPIMEMPYFNKKLKNANLSYFRWNDKSIYFRGGQTRRDLISWPADFAVLDEFDEFNNPISVVPTIEARMNASEYKWIFGLSTPTYPDIGIDRAWAISSQKNWYCDCQKCHKEFSPLNEIQISSFENCVVRDSKGNVGFICPHCREMTQTNGVPGRWRMDVRKDNQKTAWSISQLFIKRGNLKTLLEKFEEGLNVQEFYNSSIGIPYAPANARLSIKQLTDAAIGASELPFGSKEDTWMGVDVGKMCYYVIGKVDGSNKKEIVAYGKCRFEELKNIELRYKVKTAVIDLRPYEHEVKQFIQGRRSHFACDFNVGDQQDWYVFKDADGETSNKKIRTIKAHRNQCCDKVIDEIGVKKNVTFPSVIKSDMQFLGQMCAPMRMEEEDKKTGDIKVFYGNGGKQDHYFFAMCYLMLAFQIKRGIKAKLGPMII